MITNKIKKEIINHSKKVFPEECCGFIVQENDNQICIPCENIAKNKLDNFLISTKDYVSIKNRYSKLLFLYHNHIEAKEFSLIDKKTADFMAIDLLLYINKSNNFKIYYSDEFKNLNYLFREYDFYENNCFHLIKNYFKNELDINIDFDESSVIEKRVEDLDIFKIALDYYKNNNFIYIDDIYNLKKHDIIVLKNKISSHLAVYLGNNKILHQPINRISIIEEYSNQYKKEAQGIFRSNIIYDKS
jgi:proteasome lid subunit RPN8/RPN11